METKSGSKYERLRKIGIGSYGVVFKCINRQSGQVVAIKRYSENDSDPIIRKIATREVRMLRQLKHPNLINLIEVFRRKRRLHLVFDYCELTVLDVIEKYTSNCPPNLIRKIIWQTVNGINYCHTHNCIHRDIKPENILINQAGVVKLCDFGFARSIKSSASLAASAGANVVTPSERNRLVRTNQAGDRPTREDTTNRDEDPDGAAQSDRQAFTEYVATRWYRAPELLIGEIYYDIKIDIWALGCVTAELMRGEPIWPGKTDLDQLFTIKSSLGPLTQSQTHTLLSQGIYDQTNIEHLLDQQVNPNESLDRKLPIRVGQSGLDFVSACLQMDPTRRPTSGELLSHEYIHSARMSQFIQKDHAPSHRMTLFGDRTVTLPSLSPTISRTNSQALMMLTSSQQQQQRPAKRFVVAGPLEGFGRKAPGYGGKTSSIPLAVGPKQRTPIKQQPKTNSITKLKATSSPSVVGEADLAPPSDAAEAGGQSRRKQPARQSNKVNSLPVSGPNRVSGNQRQLSNMDTAMARPDGRSLVPIAKVRNMETSKRRTSSQANHHPGVAIQDDRLTMTNGGIEVPPNQEKPPFYRTPKIVQAQRLKGNTTTTLTAAATATATEAAANGNLPSEEQAGGGERGKENLPGLLKANNKRKTTTNESSASSSNYSDSLRTARSSSIAYLPSVY